MSLRQRRSSRQGASRSARCGTPGSATAPASAIPLATGSSSTGGTRRMSRNDALAAYEALPLPDTTEEHWRFTDLRGFAPDAFEGAASAEVETMRDLEVAVYAAVTAVGKRDETAPEGVTVED